MDDVAYRTARRKFFAAARDATKHLPAGFPPVLVFTDPQRTPDPVALARAIPPNWALVYRHFGARDRREIAGKLAKLAYIRGFQLWIGADPELAFGIGAAGVHWPERLGLAAKRWTGAFSIMSLSAHAVSSIAGPPPPGIDARILSTAFPSGSASAGKPIGALRLRRAVRNARIPIYALGGVTAENAGLVSDMAGLAAIGGASDILLRT